MADSDVFISHSSKDKEFVHRIRTDLELFGYTLWLDEEQLRVGNTLSPTLEDAIRNSRFLAVVHSRNSSTSPWVKRESEYAVANGIPLIPIVLDRPSLTEEIKTQFYADFTHRDDQHSYHRALHDVLRRLGYPREPPDELYIHSRGLARGWLNSSWDAACRDRCRIDDGLGSCCFCATLRPFGGVAFVFRSGIDTHPYSVLQFSINGGQTGGQRIKVYLNDRIGNGVRNQIPLEPLPCNRWQSVSLSLEELDAENTIIFKVNWSHTHDDINGPIYLSNILFAK